jgi:hypothetical protein
MGSGNRLAWGFLPSADPRGRACRPDRASAARQEPTTGREETQATSRPAIRNRSADLRSPVQFDWYGRQLACLCAHAYTDTIEELTMPLLSSKIERPPPQSLGESVDARITRICCNTPPPPFNPAPPGSASRLGRWHIGPVRACPTAHRPMWGRRVGVGVGTRPGRSVYMPNGLAVSFRRRQPVTGLTYYLLYEPKSYSSSGTASPEPWPKA